jgi:hypothetical protein
MDSIRHGCWFEGKRVKAKSPSVAAHLGETGSSGGLRPSGSSLSIVDVKSGQIPDHEDCALEIAAQSGDIGNAV